MTDFLLSFGGMTLSMSVVILILLVLSYFFKNKFTAACRYFVWTLVVIRLIFPFGTLFMPSLISIELPEVAVEEQNLEQPIADIGEGAYNPEQTAPVQPFEPMPTLPDTEHQQGVTENLGNVDFGSDTENSEAVVPSTPSVNPDQQQPQTTVEEGNAFDFEILFEILFVLWAVVALGLAAVGLIRYIVFALKLNKTLEEPDREIAEIYKNAAEKIGLKGVPALYVSGSIYSPVHYGLFVKRTVIPKESYGNVTEQIFTHELIHCRRYDLWVKLISLVALSVNWFNPLVWLAVSRLNDEMELSCDDEVMQGLDEEERIAYSKALLETAGKCHRAYVGLTTRFDPKESKVKARIMNVLDMTKKNKGTVIIVIVLIVCLAAGLFIGIGQKDNNNASENVDEETSDIKEETNVATNEETRSETIPEQTDKLDENDFRYIGNYLKLKKDGTAIFLCTEDNEYDLKLDWRQGCRAGYYPFISLIDNGDEGRESYLLSVPNGSYGEIICRLYHITVVDGKPIVKSVKINLLKQDVVQRFNQYEYNSYNRVLTLKMNGEDKIERLDLDNLLKGLGVSFNGVKFDDYIYFKTKEGKMYAFLDGLGILNDEPSKSMKVYLKSEVVITSDGEFALCDITLDTQMPNFESKRDYDEVYDKTRSPSYYLYARDDYVFLQTLEDGISLFGKYGGQEILIKKDDGAYLTYPVKWINSEGLNYDYVNSADIDKDGTKEFYLRLNTRMNKYNYYVHESYIIDQTDEGFVIHPLGGDTVNKKLEKILTYDYDSSSKTFKLYNKGQICSHVSFGSMFENGEDFGGIDYSGGGTVTFDSDENMQYFVNFYVINGKTQKRTMVLYNVTAKVSYSRTEGVIFDSIETVRGSVNGYDIEVYNAPLYSNNPNWTFRTDEKWWLHVDGKNGKSFEFVNLRNLLHDTYVGEVYEPTAEDQVLLWVIEYSTAPKLYVFEDESRAIIIYRSANKTKGFKYVDRAAVIDLNTGKIILDGGMTELDMFDSHGVSEKVRNDYNFRSQVGPPLYEINFKISQLSDSVIRFENTLYSHDGLLILKGYRDYNILTNTSTDYIVTETVLP